MVGGGGGVLLLTKQPARRGGGGGRWGGVHLGVLFVHVCVGTTEAPSAD